MKNGLNVLLIMTDQQRGDCLGIENHQVLLTPNMDSIGGNGVRFTKAYTPCPTCIAARRSILSGQFPSTHGMVGYKEGVEWNAPKTLPQVLKENGYHTYLVGRSMHQYPARKRYGYDHMVSNEEYNDHVSSKNPDIYLRKAKKDEYGESMFHTSGVTHNDWTARSWHLDEALHPTNWTVNEAMKFLDHRDPSCPFFLTVSFLAPHPPLVPPSFYMDRYLRSEIPKPVTGDWEDPLSINDKGSFINSDKVILENELLRSCRAGYYGLINHVDDQIRRLLNPLTGVSLENTIIIFTSDHGEMLGDHYMWRKTYPYEESARIPLMIYTPASLGIKRGQVIDEVSCLTDIMPTILDMTGIKIPDTVEGKSLLPIMKGNSSEAREYIHIEHAPYYHCLTNGKEKYIWFVQNGREQFFDLANDPHECVDLSQSPGSERNICSWRNLLIEVLRKRYEGFTDGARLIHGSYYPAVIESH